MYYGQQCHYQNTPPNISPKSIPTEIQLTVNRGSISSSQKKADSHVAREQGFNIFQVLLK